MTDKTLVGTHQTYSFYQMDWAELRPLFEQYREDIFGQTLSFFPETSLTEAEKTAIERLQQRLEDIYRLSIGIFQAETFVGWSFGWQESATRYYMTSTGFLAEHRNKGVYSALLPLILDILQREGFQEIYSRHSATNNQVLVPKLKAGFFITGMELSDAFGTLIHLTWFAQPLRRKLLDFRAGEVRPDAELKAILKI
jgi:hypothetical protein